MPNESAKIIVAATHGKLAKVRDVPAIEGTINALKINFQFKTSDWNDTTKTTVFIRGRATPSTINESPICVILDENNECNVPAEILAKDGMFSVGVFGTRDDYRIVSNWICYRIDNGCYADGSTPIDPSSAIYEQIISMLNNKSEADHDHDERYYTKDEVDEKIITQPDWNQNDESASDYIKNRTHYIETSKQFVTSGTWVLTLGGGTDLFILSKTGLNVESFIIGDIYELICTHNNGNTYKFKLKATQTNEISARIIDGSGNGEQIDPSGADLVIQIIDGSLSVVAGGECNYLTGESSVEVYRIQENIHQIDSKYLPGKQIHIINTNDNMTSIDLTELESGLYYLDNSIEIPVLRQQDGEDITYDYYYLESNSIISVSNFDSGGYITSFTYSYTYEWECDDSGNRVFLYAYANDGFGGKDADKLIGRQGVGNNAEIFNDYEENEAIGNYSHVEGHKGFGSGFAAHVEGDCCCAYGPVSHAEGVGTIAEASAQHVQGQFNIPDENWAYAHIVGNGFNDSERSNAHTLDWLGNAWFAGNIKIGGTSRHDAAAKTIATTDDIDASKPKSATITLLAANWVGDASPYSQVVTIADATANTMIDLLPTPAQLAELQANEMTLMMVNDDGVVTAYALNAKPTQDYEIPMVITETR